MTDRVVSTAPQDQLAPELVAEFIGTFAFVFIGAGAAAIIGDSRSLAGIGAVALAHGLTIMVFAFAYGAVSGGHFNPAVTIGALAARAMRLVDAIAYVAAQTRWRHRRRSVAARRSWRNSHGPRHAPAGARASPR